MKIYTKPSFERVELRVEERFAGGSCAIGSCEVNGVIVWSSPSATLGGAQ